MSTPQQSGPGAGAPGPARISRADAQQRAAELRELLTALAEARYQATVAYADAYLAAEGAVETRTQTARFAAAQKTRDAEQIAAEVAGLRVVLDLQLAGQLAADTPEGAEGGPG